jgi:outer membrane lipoprotein-sorting protein
MRAPLLVFSILATLLSRLSTDGAPLDPVVSSWLAAQSKVQTWSADLLQTRSFKSLTKPITKDGRVWFAAPNRFHWELGTPPETIAVKTTNAMLIIYPHFKRVERFPLGGDQAGPWREALALLDAGFPRSAEQLENQFNVLDQVIQEPIVKIILQPKSAATRRMMPQIQIEFDRSDLMLHATELHFADGSLMRNDFSNAVLNPTINPEQFAPVIPSDYKVVEPLKK